MNISEASRSFVTKYICSRRPHNTIVPTNKGPFNQVPWLNLGLHLWFPGSLQPHWWQPPTSKKQLSHVFVKQLISTQSCRYYCFSKVSQKVCNKIQTLGSSQLRNRKSGKYITDVCIGRGNISLDDKLCHTPQPLLFSDSGNSGDNQNPLIKVHGLVRASDQSVHALHPTCKSRWWSSSKAQGQMYSSLKLTI
jgi:hypothetical protein